MMLFDDEGWYMICTSLIIINHDLHHYMIRPWISKPIQMFNLKSGVFPLGGPYRGEVKSTQFWRFSERENLVCEETPLWKLRQFEVYHFGCYAQITPKKSDFDLRHPILWQLAWVPW